MAVEAVRNGEMSQREAEQAFGVKRATIGDYLKKPPSVLEEDLWSKVEAAVQAVQNQSMSLRYAQRVFGVPKATISRYLKKSRSSLETEQLYLATEPKKTLFEIPRAKSPEQDMPFQSVKIEAL